MKVNKEIRQVEKVVIEKEEVFTLELDKRQAAMLFILCGQILPASADECLKEGLRTYHKHLQDTVGHVGHGTTNVALIGPIYDNLKEFFHSGYFQG